MKHHVERTSPKGPGQPFIGTCRLCGMTGLTASAILRAAGETMALHGNDPNGAAIVGAAFAMAICKIDEAIDPGFKRRLIILLKPS